MIWLLFAQAVSGSGDPVAASIATMSVAEKAAQYAAQTERLEERVRVLERIVTDRGADLAQEIEGLRDPHVGRLPIN